MPKFSPETFFDLSQFAHAVLFDGCQHAWEALERIKEYLRVYPLGKIEVAIPKDAYLVNPELISIGEGTVVEPGAYIKGPCIIGKNCQIRHGAYIRGECIIGDSCVVGHTTEMKNSIMLNKSNAAHFAYLGDTILGSFVNVGAGVKFANLRLDGAQITIKANGSQIQTNRRKLGAIVGDHSEIGCNSVLNPGTVLGKNVHTYPATNFGGYIEENSLVKSATKIQITKRS